MFIHFHWDIVFCCMNIEHKFGIDLFTELLKDIVLQCLAITNNASMKTIVYIFWCTYVQSGIYLVSSSGIYGSQDMRVITF